MEKNRLIADFMGAEPCDRCDDCGMLKFGESDYRALEYLKYHSDWNLLMAVVEKIWSISQELDGKYFEENEFYKAFYKLTIHDLHITASIKTVYNAVIQFIEWNNTNPEKP